ncbi:thiopeptide-type bacteriocin biosynthesis protein [Actinomadura rupiterrae]|uniref:thiopeptide-type bacteriocin biosynthesis protein n=1 Tax=Actinomadura rupiterrae TaxID=559627 RepID=UPI0020A58EF3|nr:thiopeptide-type bacteriocin biosynthesis protein [Actinomadura rupiterrae]MCP2336563.1 thiopeptide-type bacteriocin biosynthesis protein [Actinomadura rupiterrae]
MRDVTELHEPVDEGAPWLEVRLLIGTDPTTRGPRIPWARLAEAFERWRAEGRFEQSFFVRKYPGLRLRFQGPDLADRLTPDLTAWIENETKHGKLVGHRFAVYEPEQHRFGGQAGMALAHRHWDQDTQLALRYEATQEATVAASVLWAAMVNHLLMLCLEDSAEVWDVWKRLDALIAPVAPDDSEGIDPKLAQGIYSLSPALTGQLAPAEIRLLRQAINANEQTARELTPLAFEGALTVGKRSWLTANATFQCNRWGLGLRPKELRSVTSAMTRLLQPDLQGASRCGEAP